jgi:hypothetical protein
MRIGHAVDNGAGRPQAEQRQRYHASNPGAPEQVAPFQQFAFPTGRRQMLAQAGMAVFRHELRLLLRFIQ